jgi:DNA-binding protein HU-beta
MASIPTQEEVLAATRKSQEAMMAAIKTWLETVRTAAPKLPSKLPQVSLPFTDKLPTPQDAVANAYHLAEQLLASQRKFAEELVKATAPLRSGYRDSSPEVPSRSAWQDAVTDSGPKTPAVSAAPKAVTSPEPKAPDSTAPKAADNTAPKAADSTAPARPAPRTTAAKRTTAGSASTTATSARKSATGTSARKSTTASSAGSARKSAGTTTPAPNGTDKS